MANVQEARREMTKTKEQLVEEKKISLSIRIKPIDVDSLGNVLTIENGFQKFSDLLWEKIVLVNEKTAKNLRSLEQFIQTVKGQHNFWNRILF